MEKCYQARTDSSHTSGGLGGGDGEVEDAVGEGRGSACEVGADLGGDGGSGGVEGTEGFGDHPLGLADVGGAFVVCLGAGDDGRITIGPPGRWGGGCG
jgi:hypothetical protein